MVKPPTRAKPRMGATKAAIEIKGTQVPRLCRKIDDRTARMMASKRVRRAIFLMRRCHLNNSGCTVLVRSLSATPYPFGSLASRVCPHIEQLRFARAVIMSDVEDADRQP